MQALAAGAAGNQTALSARYFNWRPEAFSADCDRLLRSIVGRDVDRDRSRSSDRVGRDI
jgi:hypothetical protein